MTTDSHGDAIFSRLKTSQSPSAGDGGIAADINLPFAGFPSFAPLPTSDGRTILVAGGPGNNGETATGPGTRAPTARTRL
jgi:hypothetical protein